MVGGISSLLASITGEKPQPPPKSSTNSNISRLPPTTTTAPALKRKPEDDLREDAPKKRSPNPAAQASRPAPRPAPANPTPARTPTLPRQIDDGGAGLQRKPSSGSLAKQGSVPARTNGSGTQRTAWSGTQKPSMSASKPPVAKPPTSSAPPKKGSYQDIMKRAQEAQQKFGGVGKIQHKKIEPGSSKRDMGRAETQSGLRKQPMGAAIKGNGLGRAGSDARAPAGRIGGGAALSKPSRETLGKGGRPVQKDTLSANRPGAARDAPAAKAEPEPAQKRRRVAPSTGYAGTARPVSATSKSSKPSKRPAGPTGGAFLNASRKASRPHGSRSRYDDDDDDMSDFIDDDEEDDELGGGGPRYQYYNDEEESDMEAGLDEIDEEEETSAMLAKQADLAEARLEKRLKEEKERRKRMMMENRGGRH